LDTEVTKPWGHSGAYTSLKAVVKHHLNPQNSMSNYDFHQLSQTGIQNLDKIQANTQPAVDKLIADRLAGKNVLQNVKLSDEQINNLVAFLKTLTDPCVKDKTCIARWIPPIDEDPNGDQLDAIDSSGKTL
jgi:cytochrome c peroxidase